MEIKLNGTKIKCKKNGEILSDFVIKFGEAMDKNLISFDEKIINDITEQSLQAEKQYKLLKDFISGNIKPKMTPTKEVKSVLYPGNMAQCLSCGKMLEISSGPCGCKSVINIKKGTTIVVYGNTITKGPRQYEKVSASQIASCYGLSGYPKLKLVNGLEDEPRGLKDFVELHIRTDYPKINFI